MNKFLGIWAAWTGVVQPGTPAWDDYENENGRMKSGDAGIVPDWWVAVPAEEKAVIRDVLNAIRGLKHSRSAPVSLAARKWERSIAFSSSFG